MPCYKGINMDQVNLKVSKYRTCPVLSLISYEVFGLIWDFVAHSIDHNIQKLEGKGFPSELNSPNCIESSRIVV